MDVDTEVWVPVVGHESRYEVSSLGRVRSLPSVNGGGRVLRPWLTPDGYCTVELRKRPRVNGRVHCLMLEAFVGPRPPGMYGCHDDGNPSNNVLSNIRWDTPASNTQDKISHGRDANLVKVQCPRGHALVAPNLVPHSLNLGRRACLACKRATSLRATRKARGRAPISVQEYADQMYATIMLSTVTG